MCRRERRRLLGPNVRHEQRRKGREVAFWTSAGWRGPAPLSCESIAEQQREQRYKGKPKRDEQR